MIKVLRFAAAATAIGFAHGLGTDKGNLLWHGKGGEKADWVPTTGTGIDSGIWDKWLSASVLDPPGPAWG